MPGTFTATPFPDARPPYIELRYDSGSIDTQAVGVLITRDGEPVRIPASVTRPGQVTVWKDYDAPFDADVTYQATLAVRATPTITVTETWTGTLTTNWPGTTLQKQTNVTLRTNLCRTPSFESGSVGAWTRIGNVNLTTTAAGKYGTKGLTITPSAPVVTNYQPNPSGEGSTSGYAAGIETASIASVAGGSRGGYAIRAVTDAHGNTLGQTSYVTTGNITGVVAGRTYYGGWKIYQEAPTTGMIGDSTGILRWYNGAGVQVGGDVVFAATAFGNKVWAARTFSAVAPAGAVQARVLYGLRWRNPGTTFASTAFRLDEMFFADANVGYFDSTFPDTTDYVYGSSGAWSTRTAAAVNAGAEIIVSGLKAGSTYSVSADTYGILMGLSTISIKAVFAASSVFMNQGTEPQDPDDVGYHRGPALTFTVPSGETSARVQILFSNMGVSGARRVDGILIEEGNVSRPYFDGSYATAINADPLGTWTTAWVGATEASESIARFSTVVTNGTGTRSITPYAASGITFDGFSLPATLTTGTGCTFTATFGDNSALTYTVTRTLTGTRHQVQVGTNIAYFDRLGPYTGPMRVAFLTGRAYLSADETGQSVSIPVTSTQIKTLRVDAVNGALVMPFGLIPEVVMTTEVQQDDAALVPAGAWLIHPYLPELSVEVDGGQGCGDMFPTVESAKELSRSTFTSLLNPVGARRSIAVSFGARQDPDWQLVLATKTGDAYDALVTLLQDSAPLRFDYPAYLASGAGGLGLGPFGFGPFGIGGEDRCGIPERMLIPKGWYDVGTVKENRLVPDWRAPDRRWEIPLTPVITPTAYPREV